MKTSRKAAVTSALAFIILLALNSCSSSDEVLAITDPLMERTDISITGDMTHEDFRQSEEADKSVDLIHFNFYGMNADNFDFIIDLEGNYSLEITLYDAQRLNPWQQVDLPFNVYPGQDLEDKLCYTTINMMRKSGEIAYSSNANENIPQGVYLDVFKIIRNDGNQIQCRIRDVILYETSDPDRTIRVNGTFVGVIDFI